jgi:hypothetical protein
LQLADFPIAFGRAVPPEAYLGNSLRVALAVRLLRCDRACA